MVAQVLDIRFAKVKIKRKIEVNMTIFNLGKYSILLYVSTEIKKLRGRAILLNKIIKFRSVCLRNLILTLKVNKRCMR